MAALCALGDGEATNLLDAEAKRDTSPDGRKYAWVAAAGLANAESKKKYFGDFLGGSVQEDWITAGVPYFNYWTQSEQTLPFLCGSLEALPRLKRERKIFFVLNWLDGFLGGQTSQAALDTVDAFLRSGGIDADLRLKVLEARDELARTVRIRERYAK